MTLLFPEPKEQPSGGSKKKGKSKGGGFQTVSAMYRVSIKVFKILIVVMPIKHLNVDFILFKVNKSRSSKYSSAFSQTLR